MTHSKKCKKCKKCHKKHNHCWAKIKVDKIEANIIEANEIRANKIILDGFPLTHPPISTQGFHDDPLLTSGSRDVNDNGIKTIPFPPSGIFPHPWAYNPQQVRLTNNMSADTSFSELKGWKIDILYRPALINSSDKNIGMSCIMFLKLDGEIKGPFNSIPISGAPPYIPPPTAPPGFENGVLINTIVNTTLNFNETTKKEKGVAGPSGVSELSFTGEIQNMFTGLYGYFDFTQQMFIVSNLYYDKTTKKFLYANIYDGGFEEIQSYTTTVGITNVIMQLTLDDPNDAQFLKIIVGDSDSNNFDHRITITPIAFPEPR